MTRSCVSKNRILICAVFALLFSNSAFCCTTGVEHQVVLKKMDKMLYNAFLLVMGQQYTQAGILCATELWPYAS